MFQEDPRMAGQPEGIVAGDDTIEFKSGAKMPGIQVLFKATEGRYHLGYAVVSTHYADDEKDYPLLFDIRRRSEEEERVVAQQKERRALGLDLRKTQDYLQWVDHQIERGEEPALAVLRAACFNPTSVEELEKREIPWIEHTWVRALARSELLAALGKPVVRPGRGWNSCQLPGVCLGIGPETG